MISPSEGPFILEANPREMNCAILGKGRHLIATVWSGKKPDMNTAIANGKLLAASLEMQQALHALIVRCEAELVDVAYVDEVNMAKAALAASQFALELK